MNIHIFWMVVFAFLMSIQIGTNSITGHNIFSDIALMITVFVFTYEMKDQLNEN